MGNQDKESTYDRDFVQHCIDEGKAHKKKGEYKEAAIKYKEGIENLKLFPEHKEAKLSKAQAKEEQGESLFKEEKFKEAYKEYKASMHSLMSTECSSVGAL